MIRAFTRLDDMPMPNQPTAVGEFFLTPTGYVCALCLHSALVFQERGECGVRCTNPDCSQRDYLYALQRIWLPRAQPKPAPAAD